ncbi:MAG TPA: Gfo/Idh/MocA family oxidoreductase [Candidatus Ratteibacteria bacterium]|nr:Gfo/Idh/MocA family oxidoreductase [Candidatus Ratteibacteria bacterium]
MRKVNMGVIGAGGIAKRRSIPGMLDAKNIKIVAVMDVIGAKKIADEFKIDKYYEKEEDMVKDEEVECIYIASPAFLHLKHIKLSAENGKHILCEKPLCINLKDGKKAVEICKKNNVFIQEGYMMKFHGAHKKIKQLIEEGKLGRIVYMRAQLSCWYPPIEGAWRQDPKKGGGGSLIDMATHLYDLLEFLIDKKVKRVSAITNNLVHFYKSEDSSTTLLEFVDGTHATVDSFFCIPDEASKTRLEIYGSKGAILTEGTIGQSIGGRMEGIFGVGEGGYDAIQSKDKIPQFEEIPFEKINPYTAEFEYFADCVIKGEKPEINNEENALHILKITEAAYRSYKDKKFISI